MPVFIPESGKKSGHFLLMVSTVFLKFAVSAAASAIEIACVLTLSRLIGGSSGPPWQPDKVNVNTTTNSRSTGRIQDPGLSILFIKKLLKGDLKGDIKLSGGKILIPLRKRTKYIHLNKMRITTYVFQVGLRLPFQVGKWTFEVKFPSVDRVRFKNNLQAPKLLYRRLLINP